MTDNAITITPHGPVEFARDTPQAIQAPMQSLMPQNMGELSRLAASVAESKMFGARRKVNGRYEQVPYTKQEAFMFMVSGVELGLSPLQSVRELGMIDGRVDIPASVRAAKIAADPRTELWDVDSTPSYCTIIAKRRDRDNTLRVDIKLEDQPRAAIARHDGTAPGTMEHIEDWLYAKAVRKASRRYFADFMLGVQAPVWEPDERRVIDVRQVEKVVGLEAGERAYEACEKCGGEMYLQAAPGGGAYLRCSGCARTQSPPQEARDVIRGNIDTLSVAAVEAERDASRGSSQDEVDQVDDDEVLGDDNPDLPSDDEVAEAAQSFEDQYRAGWIDSIMGAAANATTSEQKQEVRRVLSSHGWGGVDPLSEWLEQRPLNAVTAIGAAMGVQRPSITSTKE